MKKLSKLVLIAMVFITPVAYADIKLSCINTINKLLTPTMEVYETSAGIGEIKITIGSSYSSYKDHSIIGRQKYYADEIFVTDRKDSKVYPKHVKELWVDRVTGKGMIFFIIYYDGTSRPRTEIEFFEDCTKIVNRF